MEQEKLKFRNLTKDEIEVRVGAKVKDKDGNVTGATLLLYKTARVDANILDEMFGPFNWQKKFYQVKDTMICSVGINVNYNDPTKPPLFIWKDDAGDNDFQAEQVKGEASDSFKRAAFAWGIGRTNLYYGPKIKVDSKYANCQFFDVEEIKYDEKGVITELVISTNFGKDIVYSFKNGRKVAQTSQNEPKKEEPKGFSKADEQIITSLQDFNTTKGSIAQTDLIYLRAYLNTATDDQRQKFFNYIDKYYQAMSVEDLSELQGKDLVSTFKKGGK